MFEEICLLCGKHLNDDRQAYCSDDCQNIDAISPSISSASSAFSSPHLEYAVGGEVPPLVPSALGSALNIYRRDRYSVSSSSTSSTSWSITDEEEDDASFAVDSSYKADSTEGSLSVYDGGFKSAAFQVKSPGLSYARRPSGTNTRSTIPSLLHKRTSSGTSSSHVRHGIPRSAPMHSQSSTEEDEDDLGFPSRTNDVLPHRQVTEGQEKNATLTVKSKRVHNRASLPAYFSLLQIGGSTNPRSSPMSTSGNTVSRLSPPTPKSTLPAVLPHSGSGGPLPAMQSTPRGRPREPGVSRGSRLSTSRSHSPQNLQPRLSDAAIKGSVEHAIDHLSQGVLRGRATVRRNSSPPAKMILPIGSDGGPSRMKVRGRARAELDGMGVSAEAPEYSYRRGGLLKRERTRGEVTLR